MPINIRDRYTGDGSINIDGRTETIDGTGPPADEYTLTLQIAPRQVHPGEGLTATVTAKKNGVAIDGQVVAIGSDAPSVGPVPTTVTTSAGGSASFTIVGTSVGDSIISANMFVDGRTISALSIEIIVVDFDVPIDPDLTGQGIIEFTLEPRLVESLFPKVERLSHQQQIRNYPGDNGLKWLTSHETMDIVWMPKELQ